METGVSSSKSIDGEEDVFSSKQSDVSSADHLVVMVHGIMGRSVLQLSFTAILCLFLFEILGW